MAATQDAGKLSAFLGPSVSVKNLQLPFGVLAPNVWGTVKEQPAVVTVHLTLSQEFASAANNDALDQSTIHYGQLAKKLRAACTADQTILSVLSKTEDVCRTMSTRTDGSFKTSHSVVNIDLPKASMFGDKMILALERYHDSHGETEKLQLLFTIQDMNIMTLIGVNDYERTARQPLVATLELSIAGPSSVDWPDQRQIEKLFKLESSVTEIIQDSSFETLEALGDVTMKQLQKEVLELHLSDADIQVLLRLEKPKAIVFADAAMVEFRARIPAVETGNSPSPAESTSNTVPKPVELKILKPYI